MTQVPNALKTPPELALTDAQVQRLRWLLLGFGLSTSQAEQILARMRV